MNPQEQSFYTDLGERIAVLRKERGLTQAQLANTLGISQQYMLSIEKGRRRIAVVALPKLAATLGVNVEELLGESSGSNGKRGPTPKLQRQLEQLNELPRSKQRFISEMIDTVLQQAAQ